MKYLGGQTMDKPRRRLTRHAGLRHFYSTIKTFSGDCVVSTESAAALLPTTREVTLSCASETGGEHYISEGSGESQPLQTQVSETASPTLCSLHLLSKVIKNVPHRRRFDSFKSCEHLKYLFPFILIIYVSYIFKNRI